MSDLANQLLADLQDAVRSSDRVRREVLRYLRAEVHNAEIERGRPLTDDEIIGVIGKQIKQRRDSIEQFERGHRPDLVQSESEQIAVLQTYLPPQLSHDELVALARAIVAEMGATGPKDLGKVISAMRTQVAARAEGGAIATAAREVLSATETARSGL